MLPEISELTNGLGCNGPSTLDSMPGESIVLFAPSIEAVTLAATDRAVSSYTRIIAEGGAVYPCEGNGPEIAVGAILCAESEPSRLLGSVGAGDWREVGFGIVE